MDAHVVISWKEARAQGLTCYFTGEPCSRGHVAERIFVNRSCVECKVLDDAVREAKRPRKRSWFRKWLRELMLELTRVER